MTPGEEEIRDGDTRWRFDRAFLESKWVCLWGRGCLGIGSEPAEDLGLGCCSVGAELGVIMPVVNAPFRFYFAYNPLRLYERPFCNDVVLGAKVQSCSAQLITRDLFPPGGAGDYTYGQAIQAFGDLIADLVGATRCQPRGEIRDLQL